MATVFSSSLTKPLQLAAASLALAAPAAQAVTLALVTEERPPTNMLVDGKPAGTASERVQALMARSHITAHIAFLPWQRAYKTALTQANTCLFAVRRSPERETLFSWVGPLTTSQTVLYARAGSKMKLASVDDAKPYRIGSYLGDAFGEYLQQAGFRVDRVPDDMLNLPKLKLNRIDLWVGNPANMTRAPAGDIEPVLILPPVDLYLACNTNVPKELIASLNAALDATRRDGTAAAIERKYANEPLAPLPKRR